MQIEEPQPAVGVEEQVRGVRRPQVTGHLVTVAIDVYKRQNYFWSPDSKNLAYLQMNETEVPLYPITDWIPTHAKVDPQRFPQPGDLNPEVRVGVVSAGGGKTAWVKLPIRPGQDYIPRFGWVDRKTLWIETVTRDQRHSCLLYTSRCV